LAFAGLWDTWEGPNHSVLETCALLTTEPNDLIRPIHDRMPVILCPEAYASWLDPATEDPRRLGPLLTAYPSDQMEAYPVGSFVNNPSHDTPRCLERAGESPV
jgi:putative SOS response-associated peptidase YedK